MKITFNSNFGQFDYALTAEATSEAMETLSGLGLGQLAQRTPSTEAEKAMVGKNWPRNKKGEPSRPKGFERGGIAFSTEFAKILRNELMGFDYGDGITVTSCEIREREEKVESKWAAEKALIAGKNGDIARLMKLADKVGYEPESDSDLVAENVAFCQAIRAFQKQLLAEAMAD